MGKTKAEPGTPKWIDNRQKAKCLQKLRWYCQMCQKSCRDANGFKCHIMSEAHQRQLQVFNENPAHFIDDYSKEFLEGEIEIAN
jgi:DNA/RNA-binding protein KIN17